MITTLHEWVTENNMQVLRRYMCVLMETYMKLDQEKVLLYLESPEECLAAGGCMTMSGEQFTADSFWYPDGANSSTVIQNSDLTMPATASRSASVKLIPATTCCQLAENQIVLFARNYQICPLLIEMLEEAYSQSTVTEALNLRREVVLRVLQMLIKILQYRAQHQSQSIGEETSKFDPAQVLRLFKNIALVLEKEQIQGQEIIRSMANDRISTDESAALICYCRSLLLTSRFVIYAPSITEQGVQASLSANPEMIQMCKATISRLQLVMKMPDNKVPIMAIRLCAARSINWICDHVMFPDAVLSEGNQIQSLMEDCMNLISVATQSETKMHLLKMICTLLDFIDPQNVNLVTESLLMLLQRLWELGDDASLRGAIIDTLASLIMQFKAGHERHELDDQFMDQIQEVVVQLIASAIFQDEIFENVLNMWYNLFNPWSLLLINTANLMLMYIVNGRLVKTETRLSFLSTYTEPFWGQIFKAWTPEYHADRSELEQNSWTSFFEELCRVYRPDLGQIMSDDSDEERRFLLANMTLLKDWVTVFLDQFVTTQKDDLVRQLCLLVPSLIGNIVLLIQNRKKSIAVKVRYHKQLCLARFALYKETVALIPIILHLAETTQVDEESINQGSQNANILRQLHEIGQSGQIPTMNLDATKKLLTDWKESLDKSSGTANEKYCYTLAALRIFVFLTEVDRGEELFSKYLETVISCCVQTVLLHRSENSVNDFSFGAMNLDPIDEYPTHLQTVTQLVQNLQLVLNEWIQLVGGSDTANNILQEHVDSTIVDQLQWILTSLDSPTDE
ncbi:hypothetical protein Ciccas_004142 [Cichlidogyrus casuarinus]|uniref:Uncharacterized protein n=1 Tax=Cichlidogyrus casuarinus TaxID=1844966 RepID=A0ABD2QCD8_9PLAT